MPPLWMINNFCRGSISGAQNVDLDTVDAVPFLDPDEMIPEASNNVLLSWSTLPNYVSYRDETRGSTYIMEMVKVDILVLINL